MMNIPFKFRLFYKLERILLLFVIPFSLMFIVALYAARNYYEIETTLIEKRVQLGRMKVTDFNFPGRKGGYTLAIGYIIGQRNKCKNCISVAIGNTNDFISEHKSSYFDPKYENIQMGDTIPVWHSTNSDFVEIVVPNGMNGLIQYRKKGKVKAIIFTLILFLIVFIPFVISRIMRKYLQKRYQISEETYQEYRKTAFKK